MTDHEQQLVPHSSCAALLRAPERILCENPLLTRIPCDSVHRVWLWVFIGYLWKLLGDDVSSSLQAAAFASQFLDRLSGLRGLSGGSDPDALQHGQVRGELLVLWSPICALHSSCDVAFCYSSLFHLCFISIDRYVAVTDPLVYPTKFTGSVSGECVSISWILPLVYSGAVFFTGVHENRIKELVSALICTGSCQLVINQFWILIISTLIYF